MLDLFIQKMRYYWTNYPCLQNNTIKRIIKFLTYLFYFLFKNLKLSPFTPPPPKKKILISPNPGASMSGKVTP